MNDLIVITPVSKSWGLHEEYLQRLETAGIESYVHYLSGEGWASNGGLGDITDHLNMVKLALEKFGDYQKIVLTDGFDVLYFGEKAQTLKSIPEDYVLLGAESPYWPHDDGGWAGDTPWRGVNGGLTAGTPKSLKEWIYKVEHSFDFRPTAVNQFWLNKRMKEGADFVHIDSHTNLFYCMHKDGGQLIKPDGTAWESVYNPYPALTFRDGKPWNSLCNSWPQFIHFQARSHTDPIPAAWLAQARINFPLKGR